MYILWRDNYILIATIIHESKRQTEPASTHQQANGDLKIITE